MPDPAPTPAAFDLCVRFGVRVHLVPGLDEDVMFAPVPDPGKDAAFVRAEMPAESWPETASWILSQALSVRSELPAR